MSSDESDDNEPLLKGHGKKRQADLEQKNETKRPRVVEEATSSESDENSVAESTKSVSSTDEGLKVNTTIDTESGDGDSGAKREKEMRKKVADMLESTSDSEEEEDDAKRKEVTKKDSSSSDDEETLAALRDTGCTNNEKPSLQKGKKKAPEKPEPKEKEKSSSSKTESDDDAEGTKSKKAATRKNSKGKANEDSSRFKRLRRLAALAGLRFNYKQLENVSSESKRYQMLKDFMTEKGVTKFSIKDCKEFRVRKEQEAEVAELRKNQIIGPESERRVTRGSRLLEKESKTISKNAYLSTSSSENDSEREQIREENQQIFARLKGIVSDESD